jgi:hypothetical protein
MIDCHSCASCRSCLAHDPYSTAGNRQKATLGNDMQRLSRNRFLVALGVVSFVAASSPSRADEKLIDTRYIHYNDVQITGISIENIVLRVDTYQESSSPSIKRIHLAVLCQIQKVDKDKSWLGYDILFNVRDKNGKTIDNVTAGNQTLNNHQINQCGTDNGDRVDYLNPVGAMSAQLTVREAPKYNDPVALTPAPSSLPRSQP